MWNLCVLYVYSMCTLCGLYVYSMWTLCGPYVDPMWTLCGIYVDKWNRSEEMLLDTAASKTWIGSLVISAFSMDKWNELNEGAF